MSIRRFLGLSLLFICFNETNLLLLFPSFCYKWEKKRTEPYSAARFRRTKPSFGGEIATRFDLLLLWDLHFFRCKLQSLLMTQATSNAKLDLHLCLPLFCVYLSSLYRSDLCCFLGLCARLNFSHISIFSFQICFVFLLSLFLISDSPKIVWFPFFLYFRNHEKSLYKLGIF